MPASLGASRSTAVRQFDAQTLFARHRFETHGDGDVLNRHALGFEDGDLLGRRAARMTADDDVAKLDHLALAQAERGIGSVPIRFAQQGADRCGGRVIKAARLLRMPPP